MNGPSPGHEEPSRQPEQAAPVAEPAADVWAGTPVGAVQRLQRSAGNAAVSRLLQSRGGLGAALMRQAVCSPADQAKLDELMAGTFTREDFHPSTGRGLFDASYVPADGNLTITLGITFNFVNGNPADPTWVASVGGPAVAATYTPDQFNWTPEEQTNWKANALSTVKTLWGGRYTFFTQKECWAATLPPVNVTIDIVDRPATGVNKSHFVTSVTKWPTEPGHEESVTPPRRTADQSTARFHESGADGIENPDESHFRRTTGTRAKYGEVDRDNPGTIRFAQNVTEPTDADKARLRTFGETLGKPYMPPFPVTLTAHSSSEGAEDLNMRISEDRGRSVSNEIVGGGAQTQPTVVPVGEQGAAPTPEWRRVDISVGAFEADQTTVAHEFGHMFGLGDEYPTQDGGSRDVGTEVAHSDLAEKLIPGQEPILARHNDNIMSNGEVVRPHHYVTFMEVLGVMSGTEGTWDIRPAAVPQGPGDFNVGTPDGTAVA